jgi:hypothetical protein
MKMEATTMVRLRLARALAVAAFGGLCLLAAAGSVSADEGPRPFDAAAWREDLAWLEHELEHRYPSLGWDAAGRGDVDLVASHRTVEAELAAAHDDETARRAVEAFVASFHDGHLRPLRPAPRAGHEASKASAPAPSPAPRTPAVSAPRAVGERELEACAELAVESAYRPGLSFPPASLPGVVAASASADVFPSVIVAAPGGLRIGLVRIASFTQLQYPELCRRAVAELTAQHKEATAREVRAAMKDDWSQALAETLTRLKAARLDALVVDIAHNYGGNDFGDWAVRMFTAAPVRSARLLMIASTGAGTYVDEELDDLRHGLRLLHDDHPELTAKFRESLGAFEMRRTRLADMPACGDASWVWREHRPWTAGLCDRLVDMGYASGSFDYLPPVDPALADIAGDVYWPAVVDRYRGSWTGPVYVFTDSQVYSAAEMFAASMRDNRVARVVGQRTGRAGCGSMARSEPIELPRSGLRFNVPNCVRLRADGTDEIAGIEPDIVFSASPGESDASAAARLLGIVADDLKATASARRPLRGRQER